MNEIAYSAKQADLLVDIAKVLLPVATGFLVIAGKTILWARESKVPARASDRVIWVGSFAWATISAALWIGVLALMVDCVHPFERHDGNEPILPASLLNWEWSLGQTSAQIALASLGLAVVLYAIVTASAFLRKAAG